MSLFESASLVVTPNGTKASKLYAIKPTSGAGDLSVTRATTATRVNSAGLIESVAVNVPRLDYTNGSCPSILVEPQRTNLALYSEDVSNSNWLKVNSISFSSNAGVAPNGTNTADAIYANLTSSILRQVINVTAGQQYTFSVYLKKLDGSPNSVLRIEDQIPPYNSTLLDYTPTNEWQKFSVTRTAGVGVSQVTIDVFPDSVSNGSVLFWGAQLEQGSYATSYIPTTSASITRNADVISKTGISSLIGQTEGTIFVDIDYVKNDGGTYLSIEDWDNLELIRLYTIGGAENITIQIYNNANIYIAPLFTPTIGQRYKIAFAYSLIGCSFYINGNLIDSVSSSLSIPTCNNVRIGSFTNEQEMNSFVNNACVWKTRLTNAELAELTTI
jgi:hypothetical protein